MGDTAEMFEDIRQFQDLSVIVFGGTVISDATNVDGNTGSTWNYGASATNDFMGLETGSTPTDHTAFGSWGVADTAYSTYDASNGLTTANNKIELPGHGGRRVLWLIRTAQCLQCM